MSNSAWSGARPHIDESELLCKTGCGYYGNPAWNGHCSKCYRELGQKKSLKKPVFDPIEIRNKVSRSVSDVSDFPYKASNIVSKKFDKRTKAVKSIFKKTHSSKGEKDAKVGTHSSDESGSFITEFESFFKNHSISKDAEQLLRKHLITFMEKNVKIVDQLSLDELGDLVHELYGSTHDLLASNQAFADFSHEQVEAVNELTERFVTTKLYKGLIREVNAFSEEKDLAIQERIRNLNWVTTSHLECKVNEKSPEARALLDCIISDLIEIDSKRAPSDKLRLLVSASHQVLNLLSKSSGGNPVSADDFLPALIFCVIRANPPLLQSNITYVTNFALQSSLQSGEAGYFFTNLCCAVSFIEKLTADSLGLTEPEFNRFMSGDALSLNALDPDYMSESMRMMHRNVESLCEMESRLNMLLDSYDSIVKDFEEFETGFVDQINSVMEKTQFKIRSRKANIDDCDPTQEFLPPPIIPQSMNSTESAKDDSADGTSDSLVELQNQMGNVQSDNSTEEQRVIDNAEAYGLGSSHSDKLLSSQSPSNHEFGTDVLSSDFKGIEVCCSNIDETPHSSSTKSGQLLEDESLSFQDYTLKSVQGVFEPFPTRCSPSLPKTEQYTGFCVQGVNIPSIPCDTAQSRSISPLLNSPHCLSPSAHSFSSNSSSHPNRENEKTSNVLGEIFDTFDKLF